MKQENRSVEDYITKDVCGVISGFMSEHRAKGRAAGLTSIRAIVSIKEFRKRLRERIVGYRTMDDYGDPVMKALKRARVPSLVELRKKWLPAAFAQSEDAVITEDAIEMTVVIPPSRKAHAR